MQQATHIASYSVAASKSQQKVKNFQFGVQKAKKVVFSLGDGVGGEKSIRFNEKDNETKSFVVQTLRVAIG